MTSAQKLANGEYETCNFPEVFSHFIFFLNALFITANLCFQSTANFCSSWKDFCGISIAKDLIDKLRPDPKIWPLFDQIWLLPVWNLFWLTSAFLKMMISQFTPPPWSSCNKKMMKANIGQEWHFKPKLKSLTYKDLNKTTWSYNNSLFIIKTNAVLRVKSQQTLLK